MKTSTRCVLAALAVTFTASTAAAQNPVSDSLRSSWNGAKRNIKESAELMAEKDYAFKPTPAVRSVGEILAHVAGASYVFCASAKGEPSPFAEDYFEKNAKTKAAIMYCDGAFAAATDATLGQMVKSPFGDGQVPRANPLIGQIGHDNEHYGNLVTYFRVLGLVPPSSRR